MLVNFILESRNLWKPETGIKDGFQEMEDNKNFHVEHSFRKNTTTLISDVPLLLETFCSIVFHLLSNQIVFKRSVNSKQPMLTITGSHFFNTSYKTWSRFLVCSQFHCLIPQYLRCFCISHQELRERVLRGKYRIPFYMSTGM